MSDEESTSLMAVDNLINLDSVPFGSATIYSSVKIVTPDIKVPA
jgi:hypothetical protein